MKIINILLLTIFITGCGSIVTKYHKKLDKAAWCDKNSTSSYQLSKCHDWAWNS